MVSTDKQTVENQRFEITKYARRKNTKYKLTDKKEEILKFLEDGCTKTFLIEYYGISSATLYNFFRHEGSKY